MSIHKHQPKKTTIAESEDGRLTGKSRILERKLDKGKYDLEMMLRETQKMRRETQEMERKALEIVTSLAGVSLYAPSDPPTPITLPDGGEVVMSSVELEYEDMSKILETLGEEALDLSMILEAGGTPQQPKTLRREPSSILKRRATEPPTPATSSTTATPSTKQVRFAIKVFR